MIYYFLSFILLFTFILKFFYRFLFNKIEFY